MRAVSEARVLFPAVLLAAGVAAAVAAGVARTATDRGPLIASVRLAELAAEHAADASRASAEEIQASTRLWAAALEQALGEIAERRRVVLLPSRAVAAGAPDVTDVVRAMVEDRMKREAARGESRP